MTEHATAEALTPKSKKHVVLLIIGILTTITAQCFKVHNPSAYTLGGLLASVLIQPVSYFVILGIVSLVVAAIRRNVRKYWLPILSWVFLIAGLFDIVVAGYTEFVLRPKIDKGIERLIRSGKLQVSGQSTGTQIADPDRRLLGHWASEDDLTHLYFGQKALVIVNLDNRKDVSYEIVESNPQEQLVRFSVSGADYVSHTRTMYFLENDSAWQVTESSIGTFKSKLRYVGPEQSP